MAFVTANTSATVWRQNTNGVVQQDAHRALLRRLVQYGTGRPEIGTVTYAGVGNGTIDDLDAGGVGGPTETWTITFTGATSFTVSGSVSGAQPAGTTGTNYTTTGDPITSLISFTIATGGTAFQAGDAWTIPVTNNALPTADRWVLDRWSPFTTSQSGSGGGSSTLTTIDDRTTAGTVGSLIWHGLGSGTDAIYTGISLSETAPSQQWNWRLQAYTGFSPTGSWNGGQPGLMAETLYVAHTNLNEEYWIVLNSRRYVVVWDALGTMHSCYQGFILPYGTPSEWPYPMFVAGGDDTVYAFNATTSRENGIFHAASDNCYLRDVAGSWRNGNNSANTALGTWPINNLSTQGSPLTIWLNHENLDSGDHFLFPILYIQPALANAPLTGDAYGVPEGCFMVTGTNQAPQTILNISGQDYLVVNNFDRLTREDFWALRLS